MGRPILEICTLSSRCHCILFDNNTYRLRAILCIFRPRLDVKRFLALIVLRAYTYISTLLCEIVFRVTTLIIQAYHLQLTVRIITSEMIEKRLVMYLCSHSSVLQAYTRTHVYEYTVRLTRSLLLHNNNIIRYA